ncbi:hypothetical protein BG004_004544 [Podila humilis]|nr:hypothetical protein BG004_004544 [Podila humilis]
MAPPDPAIVIVGAGIAGLTMAVMLERAGMPRYVVLERHEALRPQGSALLLSAMSLRCYDQLGLLPEIIKVSKPQAGSVWLDEHLNYLGDYDGSFLGERYGYFNIVMTRPDLVKILAKHVPPHKIHYRKKVLSLTQTSESATVRCSDNSLYQGDLVIGADGAYSGIRQNMYKAIENEYHEINVASLGKNKRLNNVTKPLPKSDAVPLRFDQHAIVGVTETLDVEKYPFLKEKACQCITIFRGSLSFWLFPLAQNRIAWCIGSRDFTVLENRERGTPVQSARASDIGSQAHHAAENSASSSSASTSSGLASSAVESTAPTNNTTGHLGSKTTSPSSSPLPLRLGEQVLSSASSMNTATTSIVGGARNPANTPRLATKKKTRLMGSVFKSGNETQAENFKFSEWAPEAVDEMLRLKLLRDQKSPYGGTIGDLFDKTPKGNSVKIMLEDKSFKTWYHKRTVLIGDACHKVIPFSGVGSVHAMMDCITLMNALFDLPDARTFTGNDITKAFQTYYALRSKSAESAVKGSRQFSQIVSGTGTLNELIRKGTVKGLPQSLVTMAADRIFSSRPILTYLPYVPDYGTRKSDPQPLGRRDREELEVLRERQRQERLAEAAMAKADSQNRVSEMMRNGASRMLQAATSFASPSQSTSTPKSTHHSHRQSPLTTSSTRPFQVGATASSPSSSSTSSSPSLSPSTTPASASTSSSSSSSSSSLPSSSACSPSSSSSSSALNPASSLTFSPSTDAEPLGALSLDLPNHNNLMARPQFMKRYNRNPPPPPRPPPSASFPSSSLSLPCASCSHSRLPLPTIPESPSTSTPVSASLASSPLSLPLQPPPPPPLQPPPPPPLPPSAPVFAASASAAAAANAAGNMYSPCPIDDTSNDEHYMDFSSSAYTSSSLASVYSYYSSKIEDYRLMQMPNIPIDPAMNDPNKNNNNSSSSFFSSSLSPASATTTTGHRSQSQHQHCVPPPPKPPMNTSSGSSASSSSHHPSGDSNGPTLFVIPGDKEEYFEDEKGELQQAQDDQGSLAAEQCSISDCSVAQQQHHQHCCYNSLYIDDDTGSYYHHCTESVYTESDNQSYDGISPSIPYTTEDVRGNYYMRQQSIYPYTEKPTKKRFQKLSGRRHPLRRFSSSFSMKYSGESGECGMYGDEYDDDNDTCSFVTNTSSCSMASYPSADRRGSFDSELGRHRRDSTASLVSSLWRRYGGGGGGGGGGGSGSGNNSNTQRGPGRTEAAAAAASSSPTTATATAAATSRGCSISAPIGTQDHHQQHQHQLYQDCQDASLTRSDSVCTGEPLTSSLPACSFSSISLSSTIYTPQLPTYQSHHYQHHQHHHYPHQYPNPRTSSIEDRHYASSLSDTVVSTEGVLSLGSKITTVYSSGALQSLASGSSTTLASTLTQVFSIKDSRKNSGSISGRRGGGGGVGGGVSSSHEIPYMATRKGSNSSSTREMIYKSKEGAGVAVAGGGGGGLKGNLAIETILQRYGEQQQLQVQWHQQQQRQEQQRQQQQQQQQQQRQRHQWNASIMVASKSVGKTENKGVTATATAQPPPPTQVDRGMKEEIEEEDKVIGDTSFVSVLRLKRIQPEQVGA